MRSMRYFYDDERMPYAKLSLEYFSTVLYETELWYMDLGRCIIPEPKWRFMIGKGLYYYFLKDSTNGKLLGLFTEGKYRCNNRCGIEMPIMIFEHEEERKNFEEWFLSVEGELKQSIRLRNCRKITLPFKALDTIVPGIACCAGFHINPCEIFI